MATITEDLVSFEIAKLLKEKRFDGECSIYYDVEDRELDEPNRHELAYDYNNIYIKAPTLQMAMKWLREVHHIHICPEYKAFFQERPKKVYHHWCNKIVGIGRCFKHGIQDLDKLDSDYFYFRSCKTYHDTYEDACEECIEFALRNLIEKEGKDEQD